MIPPMKLTKEQRAAYEKARYWKKRSTGKCGRCGGKMLPEWKTANCPTCNERLADKVQTKKARRRRNRQHAEYRARLYADRQVRGMCVDCEDPCEGFTRCKVCREIHAQHQREYKVRKATGQPTPFIPIARVAIAPAPVLRDTTTTPIADYRRGDLSLARAAIRYAELCNGIDAQTVGDEFGADDAERNGIGIALMRGVREGRLIVDGAGPGREFYPARRARRAA